MKKLLIVIFSQLLLFALNAQDVTPTDPRYQSAGISYGTFSMLGGEQSNFEECEIYRIDYNHPVAKHIALTPYLRWGYTYFEKGYAAQNFGYFAWSDVYFYGLGLTPKFFYADDAGKFYASVGPTFSFNVSRSIVSASIISIYTDVEGPDEEVNYDALFTLGMELQVEYRLFKSIGLSAQIFYDNFDYGKVSNEFEETYNGYDIEIDTQMFGFNIGLRYYW